MIEFKETVDVNKNILIYKIMFKNKLVRNILIALLLILVGALGIIFQEGILTEFIGIALLVMGIIFLPFFYFLPPMFLKKYSKSVAYTNNNPVETYTFDDEMVVFSQIRGDLFETTSKAKYKYFQKVVEYKDHYFLYISKNVVHIIFKSSLTSGSIDELNLIFQKNLKEKYIKMKK